MGFDGIDINMGCPQDKETGIGACAALIKEPHLAVEIIKAAKSGAGGLPVSVKTRLGYNANDIGNWLRQLLAAEPAAVAIHGRTKKDKSKVPADWSAIGEAVKVRDKIQGTRDKDKTFIIGNGDIGSRAEGLRRVAETGVDGVMVGRGAFGNPWFFAQLYKNLNEGTPRSFSEGGSDSINLPNVKERLSVMLEHAQLFDELLGKDKPFVIMRKHFKAYASGFDGAHELRAKLMETKNLDETKIVVQKYLKDIN
jgi:tRNA-dihydrouridine synthase